MCPYKLDTTKMLASTMQFSTHQPTPTPHASHTTRTRPVRPHTRASQPQPTPQTPNSAPHDHHTRHTSAFPTPHHTHNTHGHHGAVLTTAHLPQQSTIDVPPTSNARATTHGQHHERLKQRKLLRKEVIQPHLPVRLPCYDLVPIASPTFDGSPHKG